MDFAEHFIDIERENMGMTQVQEVFTCKWDSFKWGFLNGIS